MRITREIREHQKMMTVAHNSHSKSMNSYASFKVNNRETGQDLVQSTFLKTWRYLIKGGQINLMKPFLYHILNQLIIDEYRKRKTTSLDALLDKGFEPSFDTTERAINILDGKAAMLLVKKLPEKYASVITMRYSKELSLKEMSAITGQSRNTTSTQIHRGLAMLKKLYKRN